MRVHNYWLLFNKYDTVFQSSTPYNITHCLNIEFSNYSFYYTYLYTIYISKTSSKKFDCRTTIWISREIYKKLKTVESFNMLLFICEIEILIYSICQNQIQPGRGEGGCRSCPPHYCLQPRIWKPKYRHISFFTCHTMK